MKKNWGKKILILAVVGILAGCANQSMPGYQRVYQGHSIPTALMDIVQKRLRSEGLNHATVGLDSVGRLRLTGTYRDEEEVERAFIIAQSIVGIQSTSPFYPEKILEKRWEKEAGSALANFYKRKSQEKNQAPGKKRALVIGINHFLDRKHLTDIQGEDDAFQVGAILTGYGYEVDSVLGERATKDNIESAIAKMDKILQPQDTLFIYVSSHGNQPVPTPENNEERRMSIAAYDSGDIDPAKPRSFDKTAYLLHLQKTSVRDTLLQKLAQKPTQVTRVIVDTCYSGEILKGLPSEGAAYQTQKDAGEYEKASVSMASWTGSAFTSKAIVFSEDVKNTNASGQGKKTAADLPADPGFATRKNYTFITATAPGEKSYGPPTNTGTFVLAEDWKGGKGEKLRGSFFTQSFLASLKKHGGNVPAAFDEASSFTSRVTRQGGVQQNPRQFTNIPPAMNNIAKY